MATIFLSHSNADEALVRQIGAWLLESGFDDVFIDRSIRGGDKWRESLRNAKASCRVVLCLVTPNWLASSECEGEFSAAWYMGRRIIPLVALKGATLDETQERRRVRVLGEDQGFDITPAIVDGALDLDDHPEIAEPLKAGLRAGGALAKVGLDPEAFEIDTVKRPAPFPGLESFGDDDADAAVFFGRSPEIAELLERLREMRASGERKPLVVLGASGSGKSSLVKAGVLPRLRREKAWAVLRSFRPGADPLYNLADAIARTFADFGVTRAAGPIRNTLRDAWRAAPKQDAKDRRPGFATDEGLVAINVVITSILNELRRLENIPTATALIALDQGEEIARGEGESADALCDVLRAALLPAPAAEGESASGGARLILSCRTDSFAELQSAPRFDGLECISADIRAVPIYRYANAVEGPAGRYGVQIEYSLIEALMEDSPGEDALPLLAFALERLWRQFAPERRIRKDYYDSLGKLEGLIEDAAERALRGIRPGEESPMANLSADKNALGARTFVPALAQVSDRGSTIRRVAPWTAFDPQARDLLEQFATWRLVVKKGEDDPTVEIAHETIFRAWRRFVAWLDPEKARLEALRGTEIAARTWDRGGRSGDDLTHRKRRLKESRALERHPDFAKLIDKSDAPVHDYLKACRGAEFRRGVVLGVGVAVLAGAAASGVAWSNEMMWRGQMEARASSLRPPTRTDAVALALASSNPPGAVLGMFGAGESNTMESLGLRLPGRDLGRIAEGYLSADGGSLVTRRATPDGTSQGRLWDLTEASEPRDIGTIEGEFIGYSDNGRWLLTRIYNTQDGSYRGRLTDMRGEREALDVGVLDYWWFSQDGAWLVTNGYNSRVGYETKLWDLSGASEVEDLGDIDTTSVRFAGDGSWLFYSQYSAETGNSVAHVRSLRKGGQSRDIVGLTNHMVSTDGSRMVTVAYDNATAVYEAEAWDLRTGGEPRSLGDLEPLAISNNGAWLFGSLYDASGSAQAVLVDLQEAAKPRLVQDYDLSRYASTLQFSADGSWLVAQGSSTQTYTGSLVNLSNDETVELGELDSYSSVFSADGKWLYTRVIQPDGSSPGRLWDLRNMARPQAIDGVEGWSVSADGRWLVTGTYAPDGTYQSLLTDLRTNAAPVNLGSIDFYSAQFSPDGSLLYAGSYALDGTLTGQVIDLASGGVVRDVGAVSSAQFSPRGDWLMTSSYLLDGTYETILWNMRQGGEPIPLGNADTYSAVYSDDETFLSASGYTPSGSYVGQVWNLQTGETIGQDSSSVIMSGDGAWVVTSGYAPDGSYAADLRNLRDGSIRSLGEIDSYGTAFSSDGRWLLTRAYDQSGGTIGTLYDLSQGGDERSLGDVQSWLFSPGGRWLSVTGYREDGAYGGRLLDLSAGVVEHALSPEWGGDVAAFSENDRWILTRGYAPDGAYVGQAWDLEQPGSAPINLGSMDYWVFSADDTWVVVSGYDYDTGAYDGALINLRGEEDDVALGSIDSYSPVFTADGNWLFTQTYLPDGTYQGQLWNLREGGEPRDLGSSSNVQMSADGAWLFNLAASPIEYWAELYDVQGAGGARDLGGAAYASLSPDGGWLLTNTAADASGKAEAQLQNLRDGGDPIALGSIDTYSTTFSTDGAWMVTRSYEPDNTTRGRLWDLRNGEEPRDLGVVESQTFTADGSWLFTREYAEDGTFRGRLWDLRAGGEPRDLGAVENSIMSTNGARFLTLSSPFGGNYDGRLWDLQAPTIEGDGAELRRGVCRESSTLPLSRAARSEDSRLQGRPWHPCDWRGLMPTIDDGWEGLRQWGRMVRIRLGLGQDYACTETNASGETNPLRAQLCREAGETVATQQDASAEVLAANLTPQE